MTPEERTSLDLILSELQPWNSDEVYEYIHEAEAAAELRGKRAAFEEMQRWCEEQVEICQCAGPLDGIDGLQTAAWYANERARELGGEHG